MLRVGSRVLLRLAAAGILMLAAANTANSGTVTGPLELHREAVDELRYPWSSIGKLYNETGGSCSGVVIARDKILTAAHCLFNARTRRFIPAEALHFLVGYRTGRYSAHARVAIWEMVRGRYRGDFWIGTALSIVGGLLPWLAVLGVITLSFGVGAAPMALIGMMLYENAYVQAGQSVPLA